MIVLKRLSGISLLLVPLFLFITFTASINAAQSMGGPMLIMSPSPWEWCSIVALADVVLIFIAITGLKLLSVSRSALWRLAGWLLAIAGVVILVLGITNHISAPPLDGVNDTGKMPVEFELHLLVYLVVAVCFMVSLASLMRGRRSKIFP